MTTETTEQIETILHNEYFYFCYFKYILLVILLYFYFSNSSTVTSSSTTVSASSTPGFTQVNIAILYNNVKILHLKVQKYIITTSTMYLKLQHWS